MRMGSPIEAVHQSVAAAIYRDLPDIHYQDRDWSLWSKMTETEKKESMKNDRLVPRIDKTRRPDKQDIEVIMFPQVWGSTALGYGGMGGAAITPAYTVIVQTHTHACVYFGSSGTLAYMINFTTQSAEGGEKFRQDMQGYTMAAKNQAAKYT